MMDPITYWKDMPTSDSFFVPNTALFRFLGINGITIQGKSVLEVGFGANKAADLLEFQRRGAIAYGVDINECYVAETSILLDGRIAVMNAGIDPIPFETKFDIIYHKDVIYYLSDKSIDFHMECVHQSLINGGKFIFQFIERDIIREQDATSDLPTQLDFKTLSTSISNSIYRGHENPIKILKAEYLIDSAKKYGFRLKSTKTTMESYTPDESVYRVDKYLMFEK